jgi:HlyD family secretion protein
LSRQTERGDLVIELFLLWNCFMGNRLKSLVFILLLTGLGVGGYYGYRYFTAAPKVVFRSAVVKHGDLLATISATGTIEPEEVIDIGAQIAGQITTFGTDANGKPVDYNSPVEVGTVLANIDSTLYAADRDNAKAAMNSAEIGVTKAEADVNLAKANANKAERDWARAQKLGPSDALSQSDYDTYQSAYETTKASMAVAQAQLEQSKASVVQAQAALNKAQKNVDYCTITSPEKGIIIDRRVTIGETVVSSLNAPSLFLLAKDLTRVQVWVAVNEADIGNIVPGKPVTFTVDAFPGRTFHGTVGKVRLNAQMTQNVVTYTVEIETDNADGKLFPYQTANVQFEINRLHDVMLVPNAALRYEPAADVIAPDVRAAGPTGKSSKGDGADGEGPGSTSGAAPTTAPTTGPATRSHGHGRAHTQPADDSAPLMTRGRVWVRDTDPRYVRPIRVRLGPTDGAFSEVQSDKLNDGTELVTGEIRSDAPTGGGGAAPGNPFVPQIPRRGGGR